MKNFMNPLKSVSFSLKKFMMNFMNLLKIYYYCTIFCINVFHKNFMIYGLDFNGKRLNKVFTNQAQKYIKIES